MEIETEEVEDGYIFRVSGEPAGLVVRKGSSERIYLPEDFSSDSTYYVEGDSPADSRYEFFHRGPFDEVEVLESISR